MSGEITISGSSIEELQMKLDRLKEKQNPSEFKKWDICIFANDSMFNKFAVGLLSHIINDEYIDMNGDWWKYCISHQYAPKIQRWIEHDGKSVPNIDKNKKILVQYDDEDLVIGSVINWNQSWTNGFIKRYMILEVPKDE